MLMAFLSLGVQIKSSGERDTAIGFKSVPPEDNTHRILNLEKFLFRFMG